tara:strand:+ start:3359 stop:3667 length:309 start_codon:yes stop_codon:yes gene_type:complete
MNLREDTKTMKTWLDGLDTREMMDIIRSKFQDAVIYMEAGTVNADMVKTERDLEEIGILLAKLTACEITSRYYDLQSEGDYYTGIFTIGHKIKTLREAGYAV